MPKIYSCVDFQSHRSNTKKLGISYRFPSDIYLLKYLLNSKKKKGGKNNVTSQNLISVGSASVNGINRKKTIKTVPSHDYYLLNVFLRLYFIILQFTLNPGCEFGRFASVRCRSPGKIKSFQLVP